MASQIAQIADAVKTALNDASLSQDFTAERVYVPVKTLEAAEELQVVVVPAEGVIAKRDREALQTDVRIDVGILQRIAADPTSEAANTELDPLMQLAEEATALFGRGEYGPGKWLNTERPVLFDQDRLLNAKTFLTVITLTFKLF